jgi:hypothetical protein
MAAGPSNVPPPDVMMDPAPTVCIKDYLLDTRPLTAMEEENIMGYKDRLFTYGTQHFIMERGTDDRPGPMPIGGMELTHR